MNRGRVPVHLIDDRPDGVELTEPADAERALGGGRVRVVAGEVPLVVAGANGHPSRDLRLQFVPAAGVGLGREHLGGEAIELGRVVNRVLDGDDHVGDQRLDIPLRGGTVDPVSDIVDVQLGRVARGAGHTHPLHAVGRLADESHGKPIGIELVLFLGKVAVFENILIIPEWRRRRPRLFEGQEPVVGDELRPLRRVVERQAFARGPVLGQIGNFRRGLVVRVFCGDESAARRVGALLQWRGRRGYHDRSPTPVVATTGGRDQRPGTSSRVMSLRIERISRNQRVT